MQITTSNGDNYKQKNNNNNNNSTFQDAISIPAIEGVHTTA